MLVTIADTVYLADGTLANGTLTITWQTFTTSGGLVIEQNSKVVQITNGVLNTVLQDNATAIPSGTSYIVFWALSSQYEVAEYWVVPASTPVTLAMIRTTTLANPSLSIAGSQITGTISSSVLPTAGTAGTYGTPAQIPVFVTDIYGRIISVTNTAISFPSGPPGVLTKTANYTVLIADGLNLLVKADCTSGPVTITLYTAVGHAGSIIAVKKVDISANQLTIASAGGTIDGNATVIVGQQFVSYSMISDNANWNIF